MSEPSGVFYRDTPDWGSDWQTTTGDYYGWQRAHLDNSRESSIFVNNGTVRPQCVSVLVLLQL